MNILPLPHFLFLLSQLSSILPCEEFRSSSGYGNKGLSLHQFLLDRLPLSRKRRECSFPWIIVSFFFNFFFPHPFKWFVFVIEDTFARFCSDFVQATKQRSPPAAILNVLFTQCSSRDREAKEVYWPIKGQYSRCVGYSEATKLLCTE